MTKHPMRSRRFFFPTLALIVAGAISLGAWLLFATFWQARPARTDLLGQVGEWVTRPDGRKVCRLARPLTTTSKVDAGFCDDWQEPEPRRGEPVEGWVRPTPEGGYQIMIEGAWRP